jgi:serine/threonine protein kinase/tetratricopeptide (TPR) repeat protein
MNETPGSRPVTASGERVLADIVADITDRLHAGQTVNIDEYIARHPEFADRLQTLLPSLELLHACGSMPSNDLAAEPNHGTLGDFRILREVGRGGMGVVYEAEQISLGRRVALKVLPFASTLDPKQLQRFKNEAQAAAGLHHTNIVPVFATGVERGVHYYAMQFIEGRTLAALIAALRPEPAGPAPTGSYLPGVSETPPAAARTTERTLPGPAHFRLAAQLGVQAAEALEHAHQLGIVHRDIKPPNLLVEYTPEAADPSPLTPHGAPRLWITDFGLAHCQSRAGLTMSGDLVSTLRYMSPEQAMAKRALVDHRTDLYSLGVTLYELLTLEPTFGGRDREELLRQIAFEEPHRPRQRYKYIPAELETVVLKAMEKNPAERYATAQELADDLGRFLEDRPIQARRPTLAHRLRKWARRHPSLTIGLAAALAAAVVLAVGVGFWHQRRLTETERGVTAALTQAETLVAEGDKQTDQPERWKATARLALAAQERAEALLAAGVGTEESAARVRQTRAAVDAAVIDSELQVELNRIWLEEATVDVKENRFDTSRAAPLYAKALSKYGIDPAAPEAAAERVRDSRLREALLLALSDWSLVTGDEGERQRVARVFDLAVPPHSLWARLTAATKRGDRTEIVKLAQDPSIQDLPPLTFAITAKGLTSLKEWAVAEQLLLAGLERRPGDFWLNNYLGWLLFTQQPPRLEGAVRYLTAALVLRPDNPGVHLNLAHALRDKGDMAGAVQYYRAALRISPNYGAAHIGIGSVHLAKGRLDEAIDEFCEALRINKDDAEAHNALGNALDEKGQPDEGIAEYREALRLDKYNARAHTNLGIALMAKGLLDEAIAEHWEALRLKKDYPQAHNNLGFALLNKGQLDEAIAEFREAIRLNKGSALAHANLGDGLAAKGQLDEAIAEFREAIRLNKDLPGPHCVLGRLLYAQGRFREAVEELRLGHELGSRNPRWSPPPAQWLRDAERFADLDVRLPKILKGEDQPVDANERVALALLCQLHKKLYATAARWYT